MTRALTRALLLAMAAAAPLAAQAPLPGDPLAPDEERRLVRAATEFARARAGMAGDFVVVATDLVEHKPEGAGEREITPEQSGRHGEVIFFRYDKNEGLRVLVDLAADSGVQVSRIPPQSVPMGREEIERAARLALASPDIRRVVGGDPARFRVLAPGSDQDTVEGLRLVGSSSDDPCTRHRCAELFFRSGGYYVAGYRVVVDLTAKTVRVTSTR